MIVTHNITIDFVNPETHPPRLDMVQGDTNTRAVAIALTADGAAFDIPADAKAMVRYRKTDGTGGVYDTLPDGTAACTMEGSTVTVLLAPQVLTCPGMVWVCVALTGGTELLGIFNFGIHVQADPSAGAAVSENFFSYGTLAEINAALIKAQTGVDNLNSTLAEALANMLQLEVNFANSPEECTDTGKVYVLPDGYIYAYMPTDAEGDYINFLLSAVNENGQPYNNGRGWKANTRLNTDGGETASTGTEVTGYIPVTAGDVLRFQNIRISGEMPSATQYIAFYDSEKTLITAMNTHLLPSASGQKGYLVLDEEGCWYSYDTANVAAIDSSLDWTDLAYFRISAENISDTSVLIINEQREKNGKAYAWVNTGHAFVPADYEDRILALEETGSEHDMILEQVEQRLDTMETNLDSVVLPEYWQSHCKEKAAAVQTAIETAGRNKSAFLWYTDAHWANSAQVTPRLLKYLYRSTAMNKVNFGGDIVVPDAENAMTGLRQWRLAVRDIPNHHSVVGDKDDEITELSAVSQRYGFLMAAEETPNIVRGGEFFYYIDDPSEKTRYLYLDTSACTALNSAGDADTVAFAVEALNSTPEGWHVVPISHIWFRSTNESKPTVGTAPKYCQLLLNVFDGYNARESGSVKVLSTTIPYDFTAAGGKVEFCVGGHIHADHTFTSSDGIPVILTETDSYDVRSGLTATAGTTNEASVSAIIADYDHGKISVIRIGRGTDFEIAI